MKYVIKNEFRLRECNALEPGFGSLVIHMEARGFPEIR
jgi:hypothetical protein